MKYFILAGEASGDLHGSHLVSEIKKLDPNAIFEGWGGDLLINQGVNVRKHIRELAFMGFVEVLQNLKTIKENFKICKQQITDFNPDVVIYVDYPGFNIRMAKWVKNQGYKSLYFISPNVWAWKASRVYKIRDYIDKMYTILPFEKDFYKSYGVDVEYFGHPLVDLANSYNKTDIENFRASNKLDNRPIIALLAGSRKQEIRKMLPIMSEVSEHFPDYQFVVAGAPAIDNDFYEQFKISNLNIVYGQTYELLSHACAGLITSGTATLETALFKVPQVVCYKANALTVKIARMITNVKYISLVNLILDKKAVSELIQNDLTTSNIITELRSILPDNQQRDILLKDYDTLYKLLNQPGIYKRIANNMLERLNK